MMVVVACLSLVIFVDIKLDVASRRISSTYDFRQVFERLSMAFRVLNI